MFRRFLVFCTLLFSFFPAVVISAEGDKSLTDLINDNIDVTLPEGNSLSVDIVKDTVKKTKKILNIGKTGLPLPRFVSLKRSLVNVRKGPNETYDIIWSYTRQHLPVEIIQEYDNWRRIRDHQGNDGWVFHSLLSGSKYGLVAPWKEDGYFTIHQSRSESSKVVAKLQVGVLGRITDCDGKWCQMTVKIHQGYIRQEFLWGTY